MELTYEDLKGILEMSGFVSEEAAYIVTEMREKQWPPTLGSFLASHRLVPDAINALIKAYHQYTSGKLEESAAAKGIKIYEEFIECPDCASGNETHNSGHLPHTRLSFCFNSGIPDGARLIEEWAEEELKDELNGQSWTQFAISRCAFLEK